MDLSCCTPRRFHVLLPFDQLYACHAAAIVHHRMGWAHHEVGKVDVGRMATILKAAGDCGFSVPFSWPSSPAAGTTAITISKPPRHDDFVGGVESGNTTDSEEPVDEYYSGEFKGVTRPGEGGVMPRPRGVAGGAARWREEGGGFLPRPGGVSVTTGRSGHDNGCGGGTSAAVSNGEGGMRSRTTSPVPGLGPPSPSPGMLPSDIEFQAAGQTARTPGIMAIFPNQAGVQKKYHCNDADVQATTRAPFTGPRDPQDRIPATGASRNGLRESCDGISPAPPPLDTSWRESSKERIPGSLGVRVGTGVSEMDCPARGYSDVAEPQPRRRPPAYCRVVVVGGGASGLSAAACLRARGEDGVVILERSESLCGAWARQYEGLRITTRRRHCGLPGWPVPPEGFCDNGCADDIAPANNTNAGSGFTIDSNSSNDNHATGAGDEMSAQSFVRYLRAYRRRFGLAVFTETEVLGAEREAVSPSTRRGNAGARAGGIQVRFRWYSIVPGRGETAVSVVRCDHVVVATGKCSSPRMPSTVLENLRGFSGEVFHSSEAKALASRAASGGGICIVGMGNSACDLAVALLANGLDRVHISTRSAPPIIMRQWGPLSLEWVSRPTKQHPSTPRAVQFLPARAIDKVLSMFAAAKWGRGWRDRVFPPGVRQTWSACSSNRVPCIDKGSLVPSLLSGRIKVHGPIDWANGKTLRFRHSGATVPFETVILATGFDSSVHGWLEPSALDEGVRSGVVHTVGFDNGRALLPLRQIGTDARRLAARIAPRSRRLRPVTL
ncbi:conserved unknown protein [Ectocarpus siliculosus]|uniref:L-ornithine N(5)-monooxygenase n=1 Tax=Ectocarpus siliculosus TaxID=2880 RepID=D8LAY8_ECTSI|nr:conserved unknown protein [Ectocarpus siliculosus]|eukprot:CBN76497.1 conserved unknown protein [Ectocarpus siliculosus]